jgi:23S rRNA pseudouridine1911/1915/1917 synthase
LDRGHREDVSLTDDARRGGRIWTVGDDDAGVRLDRFLAAPARLGSRSRVASALERGKVFVDNVEATAADAASPVASGSTIRVWDDRPGSARKPRGAFRSGALRIVHEDDAIIVVDKPAGLLSVPLDQRDAAPSVFELVEDHLRPRGKRRPLVVHRIDQDTSGLVVFATQARAQQELQRQFRRREPERVYRAVVHGLPQPGTGRWQDRLVWDEQAQIQRAADPGDPRAAEAVCDYQVLETFAAASLVEVRLVTGKQNQIRIQAALRGHPLVGERRYLFGSRTRESMAFARHALHACTLAFRHPIDNQPMRFEAPLPADLEGLLRRLRRAARGGRTGQPSPTARPQRRRDRVP